MYVPRPQSTYARNNIKCVSDQYESSNIVQHLHIIIKQVIIINICPMGCGPHFLIRGGYHSKSHIDNGPFYSILGVYSQKHMHSKEEIIYYFVFLSLRTIYQKCQFATDISLVIFSLVIYPLVYRCCSNPIDDKALIFPQYFTKIVTRIVSHGVCCFSWRFLAGRFWFSLVLLGLGPRWWVGVT